MKTTTNILRAAALCLAVMGITLEAGAQPYSIWNGTNGVSANTNWSTAVNWLPAVVPTSRTNVLFTNSTALITPLFPGTNNNVVDTSRTIASLTYANWALAPNTNFNVTSIASGQTLTVTNGMMVGTGTDPGGAAVVEAVITGAGGTLNVTGGSVNVRQGTGTGVPPRVRDGPR